MRRVTLLVLIFSLLVIPSVLAQSRYENPELGIAFDLPDGWEVHTTPDGILASTPDALNTVYGGGTPATLVFRVIVGTFVDMNIPNANALPDQLSKLVPLGTTPPTPTEATFGSLNGWEIEYSIPDSNFTTRVGVVALPNGRLALIRGFSTIEAWGDALPLYETLTASLAFSTPTNLADPLADLPDGDGGILWQYQGTQPADAKPVTLGGIAYDPFLLIYIAAGERGILVLDQTNGAFINYLGPLFDDDNFVDVAISQDARLYVANATAGDNNQVMTVNRAGQFEYGFGSTGDGAGQFAPGMPRTIAVTRGREPKIWTVSEGHSTAPFKRLYQFDRFGNLLLTIDLDTINPDLSNIRLDNNMATGALYLIGQDGGGLNVLDSDGAALVTNLGLDVLTQNPPLDVAIAPGGEIVVATATVGYLEFAPSGLLIDRFGIPYAADRTDQFQPGEMLHPAGTVVGADGTIYSAETNPASGFSHVQSFRFEGDGTLLLPNTATNTDEVTHNTLQLDPATGGGDIAYGAVVQGSLNNSYPAHAWYFEGEAGDRVRITMHDISPTNTLDTSLVLVDPNQVELANNDDIGASAPEGFKETDSVIEYELPSFGFYTIRATRFGGRGDYELTLEKLNP